MKHFFTYLLASILGVILASMLIFLITIGIISAIVASQDKPVEIDDNSVLQLKLDKPIRDRKPSLPFLVINPSRFRADNQIGLNDLLNNIAKASADEKIKGIFLDLSSLDAGIATVEEIRNALADFRKSGKFTVSFSEGYSQKAYYLASATDKIYMNPGGNIALTGLRAEILFYKKTFEKLDIKPEIFRHGKFKSAVEPLMYDKMSPENRNQIRSYIGSIWEHMCSQISENRNVPVGRLNSIADSLLLWNELYAVSFGMIDTILYRDQVMDTLARLARVNKPRDLKLVTHQKYLKVPKHREDKVYTRNKIAVIYAEGDIYPGDPGEGNIGSASLSKTIRNAREDSTIKAIVFRVNSSGGSAMASEVIWREIYLAHQVKPVIASLGDIAASGGYYIVTAADTIVANPNSITGSIGVFGILVDASGFFENKLGITTDVERTNSYSDFGSIYRPLAGTERTVIQKSVDEIYTTFINRVSEGRGMSYESVDQIAEGRVWSGINAAGLKLVDVTGGLSKAIELAAAKAHLDHYRIVELPRIEDPFSQIMKELTGEVSDKLLRRELGENYRYFQHLKNIIDGDPIQARLPFNISVD